MTAANCSPPNPLGRVAGFPAGAVAAIEAFETSTANLVEPGISGLINVRSRRPFDFSGPGGFRLFLGDASNQSRDASINGNLLFSDRWKMPATANSARCSISPTRG